LRTPTLTGIVIAFVILFALFRALELFRARDKRLPIRRQGFLTDTAYWLFTPFVTKAITRACVVAVVIPFALVAYGKVDRTLLQHGFGPAARLPLLARAAAILIIGDFIGYWMHRAFHGRRLWIFHAVHHSSVDLDWLSSVRLHPVNDVLMRVAGVLPVLAIGFAPIAVAGIIPVLTFMAILVHANVDWDWGPLRSVLISPRFHRWHHTSEEEARDKNFAGLLPLWDIAFGTYYMPNDRRPTVFGTATEVPHGLISQLAFPFSQIGAAEQVDPARSAPTSSGAAISTIIAMISTAVRVPGRVDTLQGAVEEERRQRGSGGVRLPYH
jgi:sterol desaturase/sphingolipid hydroxylase (fatty acid hydroxylase superfamily)